MNEQHGNALSNSDQYMAAMLVEIARLARERGYVFLAYLLQMAQCEADAIARGKGKAQAPARMVTLGEPGTNGLAR